jgi:hypothetical protein
LIGVLDKLQDVLEGHVYKYFAWVEKFAFKLGGGLSRVWC